MQGGTIGYSRRVGDLLMPGRLSSHASRPDDPRPFSSAWLAADPPAAPTRRQFRFPAWVPDGRSLSAAFMALDLASLGAGAKYGV